MDVFCPTFTYPLNNTFYGEKNIILSSVKVVLIIYSPSLGMGYFVPVNKGYPYFNS